MASVVKATKAAERILKNAKKVQKYKPCFHYANTTADGSQIVCDGYRAVIFKNPLPLEPMPENLNDCYPDVLRTFPKFKKPVTLELPDAAALKNYIKAKRAEDKKALVVFDFGAGLPVVNATYLLDILEALPGAVATVERVSGVVYKYGVYFENAAGDYGLLMPLNAKNDATRKRTEV